MRLKILTYNAWEPISWPTTSLPNGWKVKTTKLQMHCPTYHPHQAPNVGDDLAEYEINMHPWSPTNSKSSTYQSFSYEASSHHSENLHLQELRKCTNEDKEYQDLNCGNSLQNGFPNQKSSLSDHQKKFWGIKDHLTINDDLIVYGCHLFILANFRVTVFNHLYEGHQGISRSQATALLTSYWPGINHDIVNFVCGCCHCQDRLKEPLISKPLPEKPFKQIAADIGSYTGQQYLIIVDCKRDWPDINDSGKDTTASHLIESLPYRPALRQQTATHATM